ncbi:MAG: hypothetical protein KZQ77_10470 [Candidatus Thiodiazotropha sp. (ex Notomyrtea botanica)]|nr:hypothetical protein [Candidatus Thiodiazotropha sp. (ex Notomyrtea botanica)]
MLPRWIQTELSGIVQRVSESRQGEVDSETIYQLFQDHFVADDKPIRLEGYRLDRHQGSDVIEVSLTDSAQPRTIHGRGEGAISAFMDAWTQAYGQQARVLDYSEHAIGEGTDAEAVAYVLLDVEGQHIAGAAFDQDSLSASLKSLTSALNLSQSTRRAA